MQTQDLIDLVIKNAQRLRDAGVLSLTVDGVSVTLAPGEPAEVPAEKEDPEPVYANPLDDPAMFPGGVLPQWDRSDVPEE